MIEKLKLSNFQAHKRLVISFDQRITTITGDTDAGKSAIFRALGWVLVNRPDGDSFIHWGEDDAKAMLFVDGHVVERQRGKEGNHYSLDGEEFSAFGKNVPEQIASLLGVSDINFQAQHDNVFWFSESAGEVSRQLNHVINLGVIDDTMARVAQLVRSTRARVEVCEERIKEAKATHEALKHVAAIDEALLVVESLERKKENASALRLGLAESVDALMAASREAKRIRQHADRGLILAAHLKNALNAQNRAGGLRYLLELAREQRRRAKVAIPDISELTALRNTYEVTHTKKERLHASIEHLRTLYRARKAAKEQADIAHKELHEKLDGRCPVCGGEHKE